MNKETAIERIIENIKLNGIVKDRDVHRALDQMERRISFDRSYFDRYDLEIGPFAIETWILKSIALESSRIVVGPTSREESIAFALMVSEVLYKFIDELTELK